MNIFRKIISFLTDTLQTIVVAGAVFAIIYLFLAQPHQVVGNSMFPNFHDKEYILTDKISYRVRLPERGEVIVFKAPNNIGKDYIKRIIGKPEDKVSIQNGKVFVNDQILIENYLPSDNKTFAGSFIKEGVTYEVPFNTYFLLGDNRMNSSDSREFGFVKKEDIIGRSFFVYWPPPAFSVLQTPEYGLSR